MGKTKRPELNRQKPRFVEPDPESFQVQTDVPETEKDIEIDIRTGLVPLLQGRGKSMAVIKDGGSNGVPRIKWVATPPGEPLMVIAPRTKRVALGLSVEDSNGVNLPRGLTVIYAGTGIGKSKMVRELEARSNRILRLLAVEPYDDESEIGAVPAFNSVDDAIGYGLSKWAQDPSTIPVIDSLRAPLFEITGSAGEKGVINAFFTAITRVSDALAAQGCTMIATLNPMSDNPEQQAIVESRLRSALPCVIQLESATDNVFTGNITMRDFAAYRTKKPFTMVSRGTLAKRTLSKDDVIDVTIDASSRPSEQDVLLARLSTQDKIVPTSFNPAN